MTSPTGSRGCIIDVCLVLDGLAYSLGDKGTSILTPELRELLTSIAYSGGVDEPFPHLALLELSTMDPTRVPSFIGGDRGATLRPLRNDGTAAMLTRESLRGDVTQACVLLTEQPNNMISWVVLHTLLGGRRHEPALAEDVAALIPQVDFVDLVQGEPDIGLFALQVAVQQGRHLPADSQQHLSRSLIPITKILAQRAAMSSRHAGDEDTDLQPPNVYRRFLGAFQLLALCAPDPVSAVDAFAAMITDVVRVWPTFGIQCRPIVERLREELPAEQAQRL